MIDSIRSEWIKLSSLTVNKVLLGVAVAFPIVITMLVAALTSEFFDSGDVADLIGGLAWLTALIFGVVSTIGMSGEFNYNTIRPTFAAQPRRMIPLLAKLAVHLLVTAALLALILAVSWVAATNLLDGRFSLTDSGQFGTSSALTALAGTAALTLGVATIGFGVGNLIRNTPAAVTALLLWPLVIENILARLLFAALDLEWGKYLPFTQGLTLGISDRGDDTELMSRLAGGVYFYAFVVVVTVLGLIRTNRADA